MFSDSASSALNFTLILKLQSSVEYYSILKRVCWSVVGLVWFCSDSLFLLVCLVHSRTILMEMMSSVRILLDHG